MQLNLLNSCSIFASRNAKGVYKLHAALELTSYTRSCVRKIHMHYGSSREPISQLRGATCHMGSHCVTCYATHVNAPRLTPTRQNITRFTYPGGMEGWVDLGGWLYTDKIAHPSKWWLTPAYSIRFDQDRKSVSAALNFRKKYIIYGK